MWITDIMMALKVLENEQWNCCVASIMGDTIFMTDRRAYHIPTLVRQYKEKYGMDF